MAEPSLLVRQQHSLPCYLRHNTLFGGQLGQIVPVRRSEPTRAHRAVQLKLHKEPTPLITTGLAHLLYSPGFPGFHLGGLKLEA